MKENQGTQVWFQEKALNKPQELVLAILTLEFSFLRELCPPLSFNGEQTL